MQQSCAAVQNFPTKLLKKF